ncbi:WYL domain-containing protein [Microcoleus sp. FACHB-68]|nr:WYL domain-containing protein [Microcoleus sp. FACHB-68]MBD1937287.1 WYL domain-containing protein [Microcoleus sp. FACHB-68]
MLLIATFLQYPGIGCPDSDERTEADHDALQIVQTKLREVAIAYGVEFPEAYPAIPTIRKDLETLRRYGILHRRMYRWGYYLGTGAMNSEELQVAFHALASAAKYQGNPQLRRIYETLEKRLRGLDLELKGEFFYPVQQHINRAIVYTDPQEMMAKGQNKNNLFHQMDVLENAILRGQAIEISRHSDFYGKGRVGPIQVWPIQLIYYEIAWYLIYEHCENGHLAVGRLNRFSNDCKILNPAGRGLEAQQQSLKNAHKLLENGWGLNLGEPEDQQAELQGTLTFQTVKVRFFPPVTRFILEGDRRHPRQKIRRGPKDEFGNLLYVDYQVKLPPRSLQEFLLWVYRHMESAQLLFPPELVEKHRQAAITLVERFR